MGEIPVLRTTKIGNGFVKEDVMQYLDELNSIIYALESENQMLKKQLDNLRCVSNESDATVFTNSND